MVCFMLWKTKLKYSVEFGFKFGAFSPPITLRICRHFITSLIFAIISWSCLKCLLKTSPLKNSIHFNANVSCDECEALFWEPFQIKLQRLSKQEARPETQRRNNIQFILCSDCWGIHRVTEVNNKIFLSTLMSCSTNSFCFVFISVRSFVVIAVKFTSKQDLTVLFGEKMAYS